MALNSVDYSAIRSIIEHVIKETQIMQDKILFRTTASGHLIEVTETNTKIKYYVSRERHIGRLVFTYNRVLVRKTAMALFRYFMYNNRVARFKRAVWPAVQHKLAAVGVH